MSTAIYIETEAPIQGFDPFVNGKAIGHMDDAEIETLCNSAGTQSLLDYVSQNPDDLEEFFEDEDDDAGDADFPDETWYAPEDGLRLAQALVRYLEQNPNSLRNANAVLEDLKEYERVFVKLVEKKIRWHFAVDF